MFKEGDEEAAAPAPVAKKQRRGTGRQTPPQQLQQQQGQPGQACSVSSLAFLQASCLTAVADVSDSREPDTCLCFSGTVLMQSHAPHACPSCAGCLGGAARR